jgi:hypothetical protein
MRTLDLGARAVNVVEAATPNVVLTTGEQRPVAEVNGDTANVAVQDAMQVDMTTAKGTASQ